MDRGRAEAVGRTRCASCGVEVEVQQIRGLGTRARCRWCGGDVVPLAWRVRAGEDEGPSVRSARDPYEA